MCVTCNNTTMQVQNSSDTTELQSVCESFIDTIVDSGYTLPMKGITMDNKDGLIRSIMLHATVLKNKAVLDQLKSGLASLGILNAIKENSSSFESFFVGGKNTPLTAGTCIATYCIAVNIANTIYREFIRSLLILQILRIKRL